MNFTAICAVWPLIKAAIWSKRSPISAKSTWEFWKLTFSLQNEIKLIRKVGRLPHRMWHTSGWTLMITFSVLKTSPSSNTYKILYISVSCWSNHNIFAAKYSSWSEEYTCQISVQTPHCREFVSLPCELSYLSGILSGYCSFGKHRLKGSHCGWLPPLLRKY